MQLTVIADVSRLKLDLARERARLALVARRVATAAAFEAREAVQTEIERVFDRPTPWIKRGVVVEPAREGDLLHEPAVAWVGWRDNGMAVGPGDVLRAQIVGGTRRQKRFEKLLGLPPDRIAVPGKWAQLDAYGNLSAGLIVRVLSDLRLFGETGYIANRVRTREERRQARVNSKPSRRARPGRYFIVSPGSEHNQLSPGIYDKKGPGGAPLLIIAFVRMARYRPRFAPGVVAIRAAQQAIPTLWNQGLSGTLLKPPTGGTQRPGTNGALAQRILIRRDG